MSASLDLWDCVTRKQMSPYVLIPFSLNKNHTHKLTTAQHPELGVTVQLPIISVKKNPQNPMYTQLGVLTKGTIIEVNVSELGLVTAGGKVVWGRWAQVTNNPESKSSILHTQGTG